MKGEKKGFFGEVYEVVKLIPKGKVMSYGEIAAFLGARDMAKFVGFALHQNPDQKEIPCFLVVNRFGEVSKAFKFGGENVQIELLRKSGIEVSADGVVDMKKYGITAEELETIVSGERK